MHLDFPHFSKALLQDGSMKLLIQRADASHLQNVILSHDFSSLGAHLEHSVHSQNLILLHALVAFAAEHSSQPSWQDSLAAQDRSFCAHEVLAVHRGSSPFTIGRAALRMQRIVASTRILAVVSCILQVNQIISCRFFVVFGLTSGLLPVAVAATAAPVPHSASLRCCPVS